MRSRQAFTLVELLVVIAIIGVLVALLLPAVQAARESARRIQCGNNLRQLALGSINHHDNIGFLPSGGWGWKWFADPNHGYGQSQPGSWLYSLLPFIEAQNIRDVGVGMTNPNQLQTVMRDAVAATPIPSFNCPSRRSSAVYPYSRNDLGPMANNLQNCLAGDCQLARSDYAACAGNIHVWNRASPPSSLDSWKGHDWQEGSPRFFQSGVIFLGSEIKLQQIVDGTTNTILLGERHINPDHYYDGTVSNDDQGMYVGFDVDTICYTGDLREVFLPTQDTPGLSLWWTFGSAHPGAFHIALCDGSVQSMAYEVDDDAWKSMGSRDEGLNLQPNSR